MKINIEEIQMMALTRSIWSGVQVDEVEFYENGKKLEFNSEFLEHFMDTGLSTIDFITTGYYRGSIKDGEK